MSLSEAATNLKKRGWIEIKPKGRSNFYLVKNSLIKTPDKSLPRLTKKELQLLKGLAPEERDILIEAKGIFKGTIL